jgi:photosystem II stability/assembly factor-like uncharacterized protein
MLVGDAGTLLATEDGGKTWQKRDIGTKENILTLYTIGEKSWIGGFTGIILSSSDYGRTWTKQASGTPQAIEGIYFLDKDHGWAVGWAGTILRTADGGKKWESINSKAATWSLTSV